MYTLLARLKTAIVRARIPVVTGNLFPQHANPLHAHFGAIAERLVRARNAIIVFAGTSGYRVAVVVGARIVIIASSCQDRAGVHLANPGRLPPGIGAEEGPVANVSILQSLAVGVRLARTLLFHQLTRWKQLAEAFAVVALIRVGAGISVVTRGARVGHLLAHILRAAIHLRALLPRFATISARAFALRTSQAALLAVTPFNAVDHANPTAVTLGAGVARRTDSATAPAAIRATLLARTVGLADDFCFKPDFREFLNVGFAVRSVRKVKLATAIMYIRLSHEIGTHVRTAKVRLFRDVQP